MDLCGYSEDRDVGAHGQERLVPHMFSKSL